MSEQEPLTLFDAINLVGEECQYWDGQDWIAVMITAIRPLSRELCGIIIQVVADGQTLPFAWQEPFTRLRKKKAQEDEARWEKQRLEAGLLRLRPPAYREEAEEETGDDL